jgi:hypothetical protein
MKKVNVLEEMAKELKIQYQIIANVLIDLSPDKWEKIYFLGRTYEKSYTADYEIKVAGNLENKEKYFDFFDKEISNRFNDNLKALEEMEKIFYKFNQEPFSEFSLILEKNNGAKMQYYYDKLEEDNFFSNRFKNWLKEMERLENL